MINQLISMGVMFLIGICATDREIGQYYDTDDLDGDYVTPYRALDFFKWREKRENQ